MLIYSTYWIEELLLEQKSYSCTDDALYIDLDYLSDLNYNENMIFFLIIIVGNLGSMVSTIGQFMSHY